MSSSDSPSSTVSKTSSQGVRKLETQENNPVIVSLILPGVKPILLGHALRDACPKVALHWTSESAFTDDGTQSGASADQTISFWAIINEPGGHIIHGKEVMGFWRIFAGAPWITFMGNPLWRAIDTYRNVLQDKTHPLHLELTSAELPMGEFYASEMSNPICNRQAGKLMGPSRSPATDIEIIYESARQRLEHFSWVGLEGIDQGEQPKLQKVLQRENLEVAIPVIGKQKAPRIALDRATENAIIQANSADCRLWNLIRRKRWLDFLKMDKFSR